MLTGRLVWPFAFLITAWGWTTIVRDDRLSTLHAAEPSRINSTAAAPHSSPAANNALQGSRRRRLAADAKVLPMTRAFWAERVPEALRGQAPQPGQATLLFVHIPKTAGSSMERVLERLCDTRPPLCMRRFMSSDPQRDPDGG